MRRHGLASLVIAVCLLVVLGVGPAHGQSPPTGSTTEWRFTGDTNEFIDTVYGPGTLEYADGDGGATDTNDEFGVTDGSIIPHINGTPATFLNFKARATNAEGYLCRTGIDSLLDNGVMQFTMIFDVFIEVGNNDSYLGIWNGNATNSNDSELFLRPIDGGYYAAGSNIPGNWLKGEWNRFVFVDDFSDADTFTMYLNGDPTPEFAVGATDYVYDGFPFPFWFLTDNTPSETSEGYIANFAFVDALLDPATIAALGGASAEGIFEPCAAPPPSDFTCTSAGNDIELTFMNNGPYDDGIEVFRDGELIDTLLGDATSYTDVGICLGTYTYGLRSTDSGCAQFSAECMVAHGFEAFSSQNVPLEIPDNDPAGITDTIEFLDSLPISNLDVNVQISHLSIGNIQFAVTSPMMTTVTLKGTAGGGGFDHVFTTFDDDGIPYDATQLRNGLNMQPEGPGTMTDFNGENTQGTWSLNVSDNSALNVGFLVGWSVIEVDQSCSISAPIDVTCTDSGGDVQLTWNNDGNTYTDIEILRDGTVIAMVSGSDTSFLDVGAPTAILEYEINGIDNGNEPCCTAISDVCVAPVGITDLVWAPPEVVGSITDDPAAILESLANNNISAASLENLPADLSGFDRVWAMTGTYPNNHPLTAAEGAALRNFCTDEDGCIYVSGSDIWGFDAQTLLDEVDGIDALASADGTSACSQFAVNGSDSGQGLDLSGFSMVSTTDNGGECSWIDHIAPDDGAQVLANVANPFHITGNYHNAAFTGLGDYRVLCTSFEFATFGDAALRDQLMSLYLEQLCPPVIGDTLFVRGDVNGDNTFNALIDGLYLLNFGFVPGSPPPPCMVAADANGDRTVNALVDALFILNFGFVPGSPPIPPPYPNCGPDDNGVNALGCDQPCP